MSEDLSDLVNNVKNMVDSGNIPDSIKEMLSSISSDTNSNYNKSSNNSGNSGDLNLDIDTILKMKTIMDNINNNNDPRANLLYSLKPYLRESKKSKLDQYVKLLNITKIAEILNNEKKENNGDV